MSVKASDAAVEELAAILYESYVISVEGKTFNGVGMSTYEGYKKKEEFTKQCNAWLDVARTAMETFKEAYKPFFGMDIGILSELGMDSEKSVCELLESIPDSDE